MKKHMRFASFTLAIIIAFTLAGCSGAHDSQPNEASGSSPSAESPTPASESSPTSSEVPIETPSSSASTDTPVVYMTTEITLESLVAIY